MRNLHFECFKSCIEHRLRMLLNQTHAGIHRKRMKGDTWAYKKICEELLSSAKL